MALFQHSLRTRIFLSMILLILGASIIIALVTISQFKKEAQEYHKERLHHKQSSIRTHLEFILKTTTYPVETEKLPLIFKDKIFEIKSIHNQEVYIYDLEGNPLLSSNVSLFLKENKIEKISDSILSGLANSTERHYIYKFSEENRRFQSYYSYLTDASFKPLGIIRLPYFEDDGYLKKELRAYITKMGITYLFLLGISIWLSYFLSEYITRSIKEISNKIQRTRFDKTNEKLYPKKISREISVLVNAYNEMIDELERSATRLAVVERETAWQEMAKQVAHEIKNPLTPMRLTVQQFSNRYDPNNPSSEKEVKEFAESLIQQIDTMAAIATAFSTYADLPKASKEKLDIVEAVRRSLEIFDKDYIQFETTEPKLFAIFDKTQLTRVITNLVKNSVQSIEHNEITDPLIHLYLEKTESFLRLSIKDNGGGIEEENMDKIFEPKFTTKTSGMGLGLGMVKNIVEAYDGEMSLYNNEIGGVTFQLIFPIPS
ncbi:MAG TPA: ATP-binding protein [Flavobacteriaceae bacterium]|nr:ATP-binding protein [Flavobacteriaceae bacterium]